MSNEEFTNSLNLAQQTIINNLIKNMETACLLVETTAKVNCPIDNGQLRASINHEVELEGNEVNGYIGTNMEYGVFVHQGTGIYAVDGKGRKTPWKYCAEDGKYKGFHTTKGQRPQPFLDNAKLANKSKISKILGG